MLRIKEMRVIRVGVKMGETERKDSFCAMDWRQDTYGKAELLAKPDSGSQASGSHCDMEESLRHSQLLWDDMC